MIPINFQGIEESSIIGVNKLITFNKNIMKLSVYQKADFLKELGYKVGIADGTENYPHHVTKEGTQLNSSVNYAFNLETKNSEMLLITVSEKNHNKVILTNSKGDEFEFNPTTKNGENLFDFLFH